MFHTLPICTKNILHIRRECIKKPLAVKLYETLNTIKNLLSKKLMTERERLFDLLDQGVDYRDYLKQEGFWCQPEDEHNPLKPYPFPVSGTADPEGSITVA